MHHKPHHQHEWRCLNDQKASTFLSATKWDGYDRKTHGFGYEYYLTTAATAAPATPTGPSAAPTTPTGPPATPTGPPATPTQPSCSTATHSQPATATPTGPSAAPTTPTQPSTGGQRALLVLVAHSLERQLL